MPKIDPLTRRSVITGLVATPVSGSFSAQDSALIALGHQFNGLLAKFDQTIDSELDFDDEFLSQFDRIETAIVLTEASTIEGLKVKARAACWARLGDLDPRSEPSTDRRMALSIVRDLVRLCDSERAKPAALFQNPAAAEK